MKLSLLGPDPMVQPPLPTTPSSLRTPAPGQWGLRLFAHIICGILHSTSRPPQAHILPLKWWCLPIFPFQVCGTSPELHSGLLIWSQLPAPLTALHLSPSQCLWQLSIYLFNVYTSHSTKSLEKRENMSVLFSTVYLGFDKWIFRSK